jgi:hypothetical protein
MNILSLVQSAVDLFPDSPGIAQLSQALALAQGYRVPIRVVINDWITNESDECSGCDPPVSDCETGLRKIELKLPRMNETVMNFVFKCEGWAYFEWRGWRMGVLNFKQTRIGGWGYVTISFDHGMRVLPGLNVYHREWSYEPIMNVTTNKLCM